ncbi:MAG: hypothetical protein QM642_09355 [Edaphocola sp.]
MNKQKLIIAIAAAAGILSIFLPWVSMPIVGGMNGTNGYWGWAGAALYCIPLAIVLMGDKLAPIGGKNEKWGAAIPSLLVSILGIIKIIEFKAKMNDIPSDNPFAEAIAGAFSLQIGIFIFVLAGLVVAGIALLYPKSAN